MADAQHPQASQLPAHPTACVTRPVQPWRWSPEAPSAAPLVTQTDAVLVEAPVSLELRLPGASTSAHAVVLMATPQNDAQLLALATGFWFTEGVIDTAQDLSPLGVLPMPQGWVVLLEASATTLARAQARQRQGVVNSACSLCGMASLQAVHQLPPVASGGPPPHLPTPAQVQQALRALPLRQTLTQATGAAHAAAWVNPQGELVTVAEDVGRHNALDTLVGHHLRSPQPLHTQAGWVLMTSRLSYELVHKAHRAGVRVLCGMSAPTSLAIDLAQQANMTLIAFARDGRCSVYGGYK